MRPSGRAALFLACTAIAGLHGQAPRTLQLHRPVSDRIGGGESRAYQIGLKSGQYFAAAVEQKGIDVVVRLMDPAGKALLEIDSPNGDQGPESVYFIAETGGLYRLEVAALDQAARPGEYVVSVLRVGKPSRKDGLRAVADRAYAEAGRLEGQPSLEALERAARLFKSAGSPRDQGYALIRAADVARGLRDTQLAIELLQRLVQAQRQSKDQRGAGQTLSRIGRDYESLSQSEKAIAYFEQALAIAREVKDRSSEDTTLNNIGLAYDNLSQSEKAIAYYEQALAIEREVKDRSGEGQTLGNIGAAYRSLSQSEKAIAYFEQALAIKREVKDRRGEGQTLSNIGVAYRSLGQSEKAIAYYEQALAIKREVKDRRGEGVTLNNMGVAYSNLSQSEKAIAYYEQALAIKREVKDRRGEGQTLSNIGTDYEYLSQSEKAIAYYEQALAIEREVKDRSGEGVTLSSIGVAYLSLSQSEKAIAYYEQALAIAREVKDRRGEGQTLSGIGVAYSSLSQSEKAIAHYEQALAIAREVKDRSSEGQTLSAIGVAYESLGQSEKAIAYYEQALAIEREVKDRSVEALTLDSLRHVYQKLERPGLAVFYGKQAVNVLQSIRGDIRGLDKETQQSYLKGHEKPYRGLADLLIAQGRLPEAQQVLNLLKEEEYFQFIRGDQAESSVLSGRADLTADEGEWAVRYREVSDRLTAIGTRYGELGSLKSRTPEQQAEYTRLESDLTAGSQAFQQFLGSLSDHFTAKVSASSGLGLAELRDAEALEETLGRLQHGAVAIYTLAGEEKYRAILVTPTMQRAYEYPIQAAELNRKIQAFREAVQNPHSDPRPLAEELYHILIVPAMAEDLRQAKAETLMWYLDGALRYLPVAALHDGRQYLIEQYRLTVFTPASKAQLTDAPAGSRKLVAFGVTRQHENFPALPNVAGELRGIVRDQNDQALLDEGFTQPAMRSQLDHGFSLVHLATHFRFQPGNETQSFLLLGDGSHLSLADVKTIPRLFRGVELLTLSACNTGIGDSGGDGSEIEGFGVVAQRKGAKAVIATLWPVADESTSLLMQEFYRRLESVPGMLKAEALRQAQLALLRGDISRSGGSADARGVALPGKPSLPGFTHPYYWAPFFLMGNWL
jgi:CHAT domain-containing protein/Tfp pilus assembly protein PilF